jgi:hypothetical protein
MIHSDSRSKNQSQVLSPTRASRGFTYVPKTYSHFRSKHHTLGAKGTLVAKPGKRLTLYIITNRKAFY